MFSYKDNLFVGGLFYERSSFNETKLKLERIACSAARLSFLPNPDLRLSGSPGGFTVQEASG